MNQRPDKLQRGCPYTRVEYLENVGWSRVFLPVYPKAGDVVEVESELCFTSLDERQAELSNVDPRLHWGVYDTSFFYAGIGYDFTTNCGPADMEWHVFRIVSGGADAGFWLDGIRTYELNPAGGVYASTGLQLWRNLNSSRRCLNRKKWVRVSINGQAVMHLLPVLDENGIPAFYDTVSRKLFYNSGEDELIAGPIIGVMRYTPLEYIESTGGRINSLGAHIVLPIQYDAFSDVLEFESCHSVDASGGDQAEGSNGSTSILFYGCRASGYSYFGKENTNSEREAVIINGPQPNGYAIYKVCATPQSFTAWLNGTLVGEAALTPGQDFVLDSLSLFAARSGGGAGRDFSFSGKKKYFKLWVNGELIYHLIPVLDSIGAPCMYDLVHSSFYYNVGESSFIAGPVL